MTTIAERVAKGAALLDREEPGWEQRIDLETLALDDPCKCILGQLFSQTDDEKGAYFVGLDTFGITGNGDYLGFGATSRQRGWSRLDQAWKALIRERRSQAAARPAEGQGEG
jgi:hypothetical protein